MNSTNPCVNNFRTSKPHKKTNKKSHFKVQSPTTTIHHPPDAPHSLTSTQRALEVSKKSDPHSVGILWRVRALSPHDSLVSDVARASASRQVHSKKPTKVHRGCSFGHRCRKGIPLTTLANCIFGVSMRLRLRFV